MKGNDLRALRERMGMTQERFAQELFVTRNTIARWERDEIGMPSVLERALFDIRRKYLPQDNQKLWLDDLEFRIDLTAKIEPSHVQDDRPLLMMIIEGELSVIRRAIFELNSYWENSEQLKRAEAAFAKMEKKVASNPQPRSII
jgi:transcriptional regulator with XRE-family HTH domain